MSEIFVNGNKSATTRRRFLQDTATVAAIAAALGPRGLAAMRNGTLDTTWLAVPGSSFIDQSQLKQLAAVALDAARTAGAQYADVRFTVTRNQACLYEAVYESEHIAFGVRALVNNAWGFVASPVWTTDEAARLGEQSAKQASFNNWGIEPPMDWPAISSAATGEWATPVKRDAMTVTVEEKMDLMKALYNYSHSKPGCQGGGIADFMKQERVFASSEGAFCTQTVHTALSGPSFFNIQAEHPKTGVLIKRSLDFFTPRAGGFDVLEDAPLFDMIDHAYEEIRRSGEKQPVDIGRYEVVFDATATASLVGETIGEALEIDRARGYEANASGTSYLAPVSDVIGKRQIGPAILNIKADRTSATGAASVKWDDDGVETTEYDLVRNGLVADYATSREHVSELDAWYKQSGMDSVSRGCSGAMNAMNIPVVTMPNLSIGPSPSGGSFEDLVKDTADGYAVLGGGSDMDHQKLTGQGTGAVVYRVKDGKYVHPVSDMGFLFRSPELWKNLVAIGGSGSQVVKGFTASKGQPDQAYSYSVLATPAKISGVSVVRLRGAKNV